ncbi:aminotransferase class III-fold pyridoxal phosphate-dependent enzyme [archaeon]|nr:aminotransferase class III-fold pyridoxal phosphate-dependent enzyme [archaeon]
MKPSIKTKLPGPRAKAIIERDKKVSSPSLTRVYDLVVDKAKGSWIWDVDGNCFLDMASFVAVSALGNMDPKVTQAASKQMQRLINPAFSDFYAEEPIAFCEELLTHMPKGFSKVFLSNSGTESVEAAYKLVKWNKRERYTIAFNGSFHGRTMGSLSMTCSKKIHRDGFGPFLPVIHTPYAYCYRCPFALEYPGCGLECLKRLEKKVRWKPIGGIFVEPIQGEGGYIVPPNDFHKELRRICDNSQILLVSDEVQSGCYRTGSFLAMQGFGVKPDITCLSKPLGGGFPLGATVTSDKLMQWPGGAHANTLGGNLVACAAGKTVLKELRKRKVGENAKKQGAYILKRLKKIQEQHEIIGDVRGKGLMIGIEFVKSRKTKEPNPLARNRVTKKCFENGMVALPCGKSSLRFSPPLTISRKEVDLALDIFEESMKGMP